MVSHIAYKNFGLLAVLILTLGLTFLVRKWPQGKHLTFSQHAAKQRQSIGYYIGLFSVVLPLLNLFFAEWLVPMLGLSGWFTICVVVSSAAQLACTLVPEVVGWRTKWHQMLAGISALLLIPPIAIIFFSSVISTWLKVIVFVCGTVMVGVIGAASFLKSKTFGWPVQALYFAAFFVAVLSVTYFS